MTSASTRRPSTSAAGGTGEAQQDEGMTIGMCACLTGCDARQCCQDRVAAEWAVWLYSCLLRCVLLLIN